MQSPVHTERFREIMAGGFPQISTQSFGRARSSPVDASMWPGAAGPHPLPPPPGGFASLRMCVSLCAPSLCRGRMAGQKGWDLSSAGEKEIEL